MNDLRKAILILAGTALFFLLFQGFTTSDYETPNASFSLEGITPGEFADILKIGGNTITIVDLRSEAEFQTGSIEGSINIPFEKLASKETLGVFTESRNIYFVGSDEAKSHQAALFCAFKGFSAKAVNGNVFLILQLVQGQKPDAWRFYSAEKQHYSYGGYFRQAQSAPSTSTSTKKEVKSSAGGC
jgi:rhodanese-related sulfurtransferase